MTYKGKGTVDSSHKLWVYLFDSPNIGAGTMPIGQLALEKNGTDAVFDSVAGDKVYVAVAFDESGAMMGDGPPPTGSPIGILMGPGRHAQRHHARRQGASGAQLRRHDPHAVRLDASA